MSRLLVIFLSVSGAYFWACRLYAPAGSVAFHLGGFGVTWLALVCVAAGVIAYKVK